MRRGASLMAVLAAAMGIVVAAGYGCARARDTASFDDASPPAIADTAPPDASPPPPLGTTPDAADPLAGCATATADVTRQPIYMLILLDGSGSMNEEYKWSAVVPALGALVDDLLAQHDPSFGLGLTIFSDMGDPTNGTGPYPKMDVPIAYVDDVHAFTLHERLDNTSPKGPTPTLAVLQGQYPLVEAFTPDAPLLAGGKKVVVLMTDGVPYPNSDAQRGPCVQLVGDELAKPSPAGPITTFAVGIGHYYPYDPTTYDVDFMGNLALAGGAPNDPCQAHELMNINEMCHFQITPAPANSPIQLEQDFARAFDKIRSEVTSCAMTLVKNDGGGLVDPTKVNVVFNDTEGSRTVFAEDPQDGWTYDDPNAPTQVILHGAACFKLKNDPDGRLDVVLGCKSIVK